MYNNDVKVGLRSFLPFNAKLTVCELQFNQKMNAPEKQAITLCKDNYGFGYKFYISKTKEIISTYNYKRLNSNEFPTGSSETTIIGNFKNNIDKQVGNTQKIIYLSYAIMFLLSNSLPRSNYINFY